MYLRAQVGWRHHGPPCFNTVSDLSRYEPKLQTCCLITPYGVGFHRFLFTILCYAFASQCFISCCSLFYHRGVRGGLDNSCTVLFPPSLHPSTWHTTMAEAGGGLSVTFNLPVQILLFVQAPSSLSTLVFLFSLFLSTPISPFSFRFLYSTFSSVLISLLQSLGFIFSSISVLVYSC